MVPQRPRRVRALRGACLLSAAVLLAAFAACGDAPDAKPPSAATSGDFDSGPVPTFGDDGGGGDICSRASSLPGEAYGAGVDAQKAAVFQKAPGSSPAFVFDPPSGVQLPSRWPSPVFLAHTDALPALARLELKVNGLTAAFTGAPAPAPAAHAGASITGSWWTIALPDPYWQSAECALAGGGEIQWRLLHVATGAQAPAGIAQGTLRLLASSAAADMTYWQITQPDDGQNFTIERLAVLSGKSQTLVPQPGQCIGCHTVSPDGQDIAYQEVHAGPPGLWLVSLVRAVPNGPPIPSPSLSPAAASILASTSLQVPSISRGAWSDSTGRWLSVVTRPSSKLALMQVDSPSAALAFAPPTSAPPTDAGVDASGDAGSDAGAAVSALVPALPAFAPDATRIVFVATDSMRDGHTSQSPGTFDLYQVPVQLVKDSAPVFGAATGVPFASGTPQGETYPSFSHDGKLLAFVRVPAGSGAYDAEQGRIEVMRADGSSAPVEIAANAAPADASVYSGAGLTNSWPRFGETSVKGTDGEYYFLLFSSRRGSSQLWEDRGTLGSVPVGGRPLARLYLAVVRANADGSLTTFPAVLVPGQRVSAGAHTPSFTTVTSVPPPPQPTR